jgi:DNA invertase Pin-like site-specific DNA recombinase
MQAIGYIRVSSEEQSESGLGLEAQREKIKAYCLLKDLELTEIFEDAGVSGGKPLERRAAGARLLNAARKTRAVVVVAKMDRLFRSVADAACTINEFDRKGIPLVCIAEGFDATNIYGKAMMQVASVFAELERGMIRERTKSAMGVKRSKGQRISRYAPYGSDFNDGMLVDNAAERAVIVRMKEWLSAGEGFQQIADRLNAEGVPSKTGGQWIYTSVKSILRKAA